MRRLAKVLGVILLILVLLVAAGVVFLRMSRGSFEPPAELKPGLVDTSGAGVHLFAARAGGGVILFDTGADPEGRAIDGLLAALKATREEVTDIFLTHGHGDHTAGAHLFPKARLHAGAADVALTAGEVGPEATLAKIFMMILPPTPATVTSPLAGAAEISVGDKKVRALPMPGHTAGSYAYLYEGVLFVGDTMMLSDGALATGLAAFEAHPEENRQAILGLRAPLEGADIDRVCTAHGGCTAAGEGRARLDAFFTSLAQ
jgi:hydroxyacylglutathione hydrolase